MNPEEAKKKLVRVLKSFGGSRPPDAVFRDWLEMTAISIQNAVTIVPGKTCQERDRRWETLRDGYTDSEINLFAEMIACLVWALHEPQDVLGQVYMEAQLGNKLTGQFFTPASAYDACSRLALSGVRSDGDVIRLHEPACGSGGLIIGTCVNLERMGINYQRQVEVWTQDLDWGAVWMCYIQLSLLGVKAIVAQGDTLTDPWHDKYPPMRVFKTPAWMGALEG